MIRPAKHQDIPRCRAIMRDAYDRSDYAGTLCGFDDAEATRLLVHAVQKHQDGAFFEVAESKGEVEAFIVGILSRVYCVGTKLRASDLFWLATEQVEPRQPRKLMKNMITWARSNPDVVEVYCGATAVVQDPDKAGRILESLGMKHYGAIYRLPV